MGGNRNVGAGSVRGRKRLSDEERDFLAVLGLDPPTVGSGNPSALDVVLIEIERIKKESPDIKGLFIHTVNAPKVPDQIVKHPDLRVVEVKTKHSSVNGNLIAPLRAKGFIVIAYNGGHLLMLAP